MSRHGAVPGTRLLAALTLALVAGSVAAAAASSPTADEIVTRYIAARGGVKKIRSIVTLRQTGHATAGADRHALVTREIKRPGKTRFEFTTQGVTAVFGSNGVRGWRVSPFEGDLAPKSLPQEAVKEAVEQGDIEGPLVDYRAKGHQVELAGRETVGGRAAYKLKLTLKSGGIRFEYIDEITSYLLRTDSMRLIRGRDVIIQTTFDDYKKTSGLLFPRRVEIVAAGRPQPLRIVVEKVEVNPKLDDARFDVPVNAEP